MKSYFKEKALKFRAFYIKIIYDLIMVNLHNRLQSMLP
jgi:hypothetical protein